MADDKEQAPKFVVKDRRRFDSSGDERESTGDSERAQAKAAQPANPKGSATPRAESPKTQTDAMSSGTLRSHAKLEGNGGVMLGEPPNTELSFSSFVISLATQALMQMGEIEAPPGMQVTIDRESARNTIDILALLDLKTKGNLTTEEAQLMEEVLHNLRISYLRKAKAGV